MLLCEVYGIFAVVSCVFSGVSIWWDIIKRACMPTQAATLEIYWGTNCSVLDGTGFETGIGYADGVIGVV